MADSLLNRAINFIAHGESEDLSDREFLLKQIAKDLGQNKFGKFYRIKTDDMEPSFAAYMYSIYKVIYPVQVFFQYPSRDDQIKQIILKSCMDERVEEILRSLQPETLAERKRTTPPEELSRQLREESRTLSSVLHQAKAIEVDQCYDLLQALKKFALFDYGHLLQKFDSGLLEDTLPRFAAIKADAALGEELADFYCRSLALKVGNGWNEALEVLAQCNNGKPLLQPREWNEVLESLGEIWDSKSLEMIIRLILKNPIWEAKVVFPDEQMSTLWLEEKQKLIHEVIQEIAEKQRSSQITSFVSTVFSGTNPFRLIYYTPERSNILRSKGLVNYTYAGGLNYLLAFIQDYLDKDIQELCDILLIPGQWSNLNDSRQMSGALHDGLDITGEIFDLDQDLSEAGTTGSRLRGALFRVERDRSQADYINSIVEDVNGAALNIINRTIQSLIVVGKHMKNLIEDVHKRPSELIINWRELENIAKYPLAPRLEETYRRINQFVQLMYLETHPAE